MKDEPTTATICTAMMRLGTRMAAIFDQHFADFDITQAQFRVMLAIWNEGGAGIAPSQLARNLLLERATVSVLTQRMLDRGLLERAPGENRRSFRLRVSAAGESLLYTVIPQACTLADRVLAGNSVDDLLAALRFLERLETTLRTMTNSDGPTPSDSPDPGKDS